MRGTVVSLMASAMVLSQAASAHNDAKICESALIVPMYTLAKSDSGKVFGGLTNSGLERVSQAMSAIQHNYQAGNIIFEGNETLLRLYFVNLSGGFNMLASGGPGGGKSAVPNWLFGDQEGTWSIQLDDASRRMDIIGGQTEEDFKVGRSNINTKGTLVEAKIGIIDEINNASPTVLASLLSLANPKERFVTVAGRKLKAENLRGLFMTGNATLFEMIENFKNLGMQSGPAFLNRITIKAQIPNWLSIQQQERRDAWIEKRNALKSDLRFASDEQDRQEAEQALASVQARAVDFDAVEAFAMRAFEATDDLIWAARDLANEIRRDFRNEKLVSEQSHAENPMGHPAIFTPSADWTERFREDLIKMIKISVAIDYLIHMDKKDLEIKQPIPLSRMSLWRAYAMAVQVPGGLTRFNPSALSDGRENDDLVQFGLVRDLEGQLLPMNTEELIRNAESKREQQALSDMFKEHRIFNDALRKVLSAVKKTIQMIAIETQQDPARLQTQSKEIEFILLKKGM